ncbi:hypothetical protein Q9L58_009477 [Maublancomyces gigas]|uniref:Aldehyde dehydrogenase domain-containing protein n=1 Tax=Discina gigas TaxID=1032678 RepID=A0ABR3G6T2_9PEZI
MKSDPSYTVPLFFNNVEVTSKKTFPVNNPADNTLLWNASAASIDDVEKVTKAAAAAFPAWSRTKYTKRRELIRNFGAILEKRRAELIECSVLETGSSVHWAELNVTGGISVLEHVAGTVVTINGSRAAYVTKEPYGVILEIVPWNAPIILLIRAIFFPIACGNSVIIKASETSPRTHFLVTSIAAEAGFPPGVINIISHAREDAVVITNALIEHEVVKKISFTGSSAVARKLAAKAGQCLKPILLELGGKAPLIVMEDADLEAAAKDAALGSFMHGGQVCMSTEKIIVHSAVIERFTAIFNEFSKGYGESQLLAMPGANLGIKKLVDNAVANGAKIVGGADAYASFEFKNSNAFPNLVLQGITDKMDLYHTESFGPLASIISVDSEEEALRIANDTIFGLVASVWTKDLARGLRMAKQIDAGACHINGPTFQADPGLFPPGWKASGTGSLVGRTAFDEFLHLKITTFGI